MPNSSEIHEPSETLASLTIDPIGYVESPYKEKFAIPRQPGLVDAAHGKVILVGQANNADTVKALQQFSHLWLLFVFHQTQQQGWKPLVRPPRLGGNKKVGVFSTRSTFRPNPIGMSVVKLENIDMVKQDVVIHISGIDLLDKTPIVDIKPYIPYSDSIPTAQAGFAQTEPEAKLTVHFSDGALAAYQQVEQRLPQLLVLIEQVLAQDPRPAYKKNQADQKNYGMHLYDLNIEWQMQTLTEVMVTNIAPASKANHVKHKR